MQLSIFDYEPVELAITSITCDLFGYKVGVDNVAEINVTNHGSDDLTIYEILDASGELIVFAGLLNPHSVEWSDVQCSS